MPATRPTSTKSPRPAASSCATHRARCRTAVGAPGTACAEGAGLVLPTTGSDFTFTRTGTPPAYADTDENLADFGAPSGEADGTPCGEECAAAPAPTPIDEIQGSGETSPMLGDKVQITGVVVGVDNQAGVSNYTELDERQEGIYVETPTAEQDTDTQTSEGIFVGGLPAEDRDAPNTSARPSPSAAR